MFCHLSPDWQNVIESHLLQIENHSGSKRSRATYQYILSRFFQEVSPEKATRTDVLRFINQPSQLSYSLGQPVGPYCINQRLTVLSSFFKFASAYDLPDSSPILDHKMPTQGVPFLRTGSSYKGMSQDEVERLFAVIPDTPRGQRDRSLLAVLWWTGRRRNELVKLRARDISETVLVDPDGTRRHGFSYCCTIKGHSREVFTGEMPFYAMESIKEYWRVSGRTIEQDSFVWTNIRNSCGHLHHEEPIQGDWLNHLVKQYARLAGLDTTRISCHSLRRCGAMLRHQNGASLESIRIWLNHTSLSTTQKYIQACSSQADPEALRLEAKFAHLGIAK